MASLSRVALSSLRLHSRLLRPCVVRAVGISTSRKNKDTTTITDALAKPTKPKLELENEDNWIGWGFDNESQRMDRTNMHLTFFVTVTLCIVTTGFIWSYLPDYRLMDWAQREGYLELRRREAGGLPLIDPNLIPTENVELPEDEELGSTEIII